MGSLAVSAAVIACDMVPMMDVARMKATLEAVKKRSGLGGQNFQRVRGSSRPLKSLSVAAPALIV